MTYFETLLYSLTKLIPKPKNTAVILVFHTISDSKVYNSVSSAMFEKQMKLLRKKFNPVSLDTLGIMLKKKIIDSKTVCVTFDDGFMDTFVNALPILKRYNIPATVFIETGNVGLESKNQGEMFPMMGKAELLKLHQSEIISIEPHTINHPRLTQISDNEIYSEVNKSKNFLEQLLNKKCVHFAYPYGLHNKRVRKQIIKTGIKYAYTTKDGVVRHNSDVLQLKRNGMNRTLTLKHFESICYFGKLSRKRFSLGLQQS